MKICMVGDSHLMMMLKAHAAGPSNGIEVTPVTWPREHEQDFTLKGTHLSADHPGLAAFWARGGLPPKVDLAAFDRLVFVSHTATAFNVFSILREHVVSDWNDAKPVMQTLNGPLGNPDKRRLLSPAVFKQCLVGGIQANHTYKFIDQIRQHSDIPIAIVPAPFLAENTLQHRPKMWALRTVLRAKDGAAMMQALHEAHLAAFGRFADVSVLRQPDETVVQGCLTIEKYRQGALKYGSNEAHSDSDVLHAGPMMGQLFWQQLGALDA